MKILISLVLLALIYFLFRKFTAGKSSPDQNAASQNNLDSEAPTESIAETAQAAASEAVDTATSSAVAASAAVVAAVSADQSNSTTSNATPAHAPTSQKPLPVEHLEGIDRSTGKALRALGISDTKLLLEAGVDTLAKVGLNPAAAKVLQAQASLSALSGVTPSEAAALAKSGIDSISSLAGQNPADLMTKIARANRGGTTLKSAPGVQQLQRLISSAKAAA